MIREKKLKIVERMMDAAKAGGYKLDSDMVLERLNPGISRRLEEQDRRFQEEEQRKIDRFFRNKKERIQSNFKGKLQNLLEGTSVMIDFSSENYILTVNSLPYGDCITWSHYFLIDDTLKPYMEHVKILGKIPYRQVHTIYTEFNRDEYIDALKKILYILLKDELPSKCNVGIYSTQDHYPVYGKPYSIGGGCSYGPQFACDVISENYTYRITVCITYQNS